MVKEKFLKRTFILQANEVREGIVQFRLTIPLEFVQLAGWEKGDRMNMEFIIGSGKVIIEKEVSVDE